MTVDYVGKFFTKDGFDFGGLLNADFFQPVRILYQHQHYISATKLLVVAIDSVGYVEFGDASGTFVKWLEKYADLGKLGITATELWEHRNSLLHMSNLDSRKVLTGSVRRLVAYVGEVPEEVKLNQSTTGYYNLQKLILDFATACGRWVETYEKDREKIDAFVARYDLIASDARMLRIQTQ